MKNQGCDIGLIGLGVMGRNLVFNTAEQGFSMAFMAAAFRRLPVQNLPTPISLSLMKVEMAVCIQKGETISWQPSVAIST
jgi:hypothetical protein